MSHLCKHATKLYALDVVIYILRANYSLREFNKPEGRKDKVDGEAVLDDISLIFNALSDVHIFDRNMARILWLPYSICIPN